MSRKSKQRRAAATDAQFYDSPYSGKKFAWQESDAVRTAAQDVVDIHGQPIRDGNSWGNNGQLQTSFDMATGKKYAGNRTGKEYTGAAYVPKKWCQHYGEVVGIAGPNHKFCGAVHHQVDIPCDAAAIVDCTGKGFKDDTFYIPEQFKALRDHVQKLPPVIALPWPDHGLPPVKFSFWPTLLRTLPHGRIIVCCVGGHGRTGTTLALMSVMLENRTGYDAIHTLRETYCDQAVETKGQVAYVSDFAGWWQKNREEFPLA